jgi:DNA invertase Pin-like site-specific DNA recombinase
MTIRAGIYCRISRDWEGKQLGVERQRQDCLRIAENRGWTVVEHYVDNDVSAGKTSKKVRKEYLRLLGDIEAGKLDAVVLWMEDRLQRQVMELAEFLKVCDAAGVTRIASVGGEFDLSDPDQRTLLYIKAAMAEAEIEKMRARMRRKNLERAEKGGRHPGGFRAFGTVGAGKQWVSESQAQAEQELIAEAAQRILAGDSLRGIANDWNRREIRTPTGRAWTNVTLRTMLLSPRLIGQREHNGRLHPATWEPILPRQTWEAAKGILEDPERVTKGRGGIYRHLLSGLVKCSRCGTTMTVRGRAAQRRYCCSTAQPGGCGRLQRSADQVENLITEALFVAVESPTWDQVADRSADDPTRELYERLARDQARLDKLDDEQVLAALDDDGVKAASLRRVRHDIEERMERTRNRAARMRGEQVAAAVPRNLRDVWADLSLDRKRAILAVIVERVEIHPQGMSPVFDPNAIMVTWRA